MSRKKYPTIRMQKHNLYLLLSILINCIACVPQLATAATEPKPQAIGKFGDWRAYKIEKSYGAECFIIGRPQKNKGNYTRRDPAFVHISRQTDDNTINTPSFSAGYRLKPSEKVSVSIDDHKFGLLPDGEVGWPEDETDDAAILSAMRKGQTMIVKGRSIRGTLTTDTYNLKGLTAAYNAMNKACS